MPIHEQWLRPEQSREAIPPSAQAEGPLARKLIDAGIIYTQVSKSSSCLLGEVFTTDGRIKAMNLATLQDDKHFFPNYNAAPEVHSRTYE